MQAASKETQQVHQSANAAQGSEFAELNQRLAAEMQRHVEAVAAIQAEMAKLQHGVREGTHELLEGQRPATTDTPEAVKTFDWQKQYAEAVSVLRADGLASFEPTLEAVQKAFTPERQEAFALLRHPKLIFVPQISFAAKVRAINASGLAPDDTFVNEDVFGAVPEEGDKEVASAVRPVVIEAQQEMDVAPFDDLDLPLKKRIATMRRKRSPNLGGTDRDSYAALQLHSLRQGNPVDQETWTMFDADEALEGNAVPHGDWYGDQVSFDGGHADSPGESARFRFSVGGDVLQS